QRRGRPPHCTGAAPALKGRLQGSFRTPEIRNGDYSSETVIAISGQAKWLEFLRPATAPAAGEGAVAAPPRPAERHQPAGAAALRAGPAAGDLAVDGQGVGGDGRGRAGRTLSLYHGYSGTDAAFAALGRQPTAARVRSTTMFKECEGWLL